MDGSLDYIYRVHPKARVCLREVRRCKEQSYNRRASLLSQSARQDKIEKRYSLTPWNEEGEEEEEEEEKECSLQAKSARRHETMQGAVLPQTACYQNGERGKTRSLNRTLSLFGIDC